MFVVEVNRANHSFSGQSGLSFEFRPVGPIIRLQASWPIIRVLGQLGLSFVFWVNRAHHSFLGQSGLSSVFQASGAYHSF